MRRKTTRKTTRKTSRKVKRTKSPTRCMPVRRRTRRVSRRRRTTRVARRVYRRTGRGLGRIRSIFSGGLIGSGVKAYGASAFTQILANRIGFGQYGGIAGAGAAYLAGGVTGLAVSEGIKMLAGQPSLITSLGSNLGFGGGTSQGGMSV